MSPWNIIGWGLLGFTVAVIVIAVIRGIILWVAYQWAHFESKNVALAVGQMWSLDGERYTITYKGTRNDGSTYFLVSSWGASWATSQAEWNERWKHNLLFLIQDVNTQEGENR